MEGGLRKRAKVFILKALQLLLEGNAFIEPFSYPSTLTGVSQMLGPLFSPPLFPVSLFVRYAYPTLFSVVTLDKCVRNFSRFTGCSLGEAIKCATYNPAKLVSIQISYLFGTLMS